VAQRSKDLAAQALASAAGVPAPAAGELEPALRQAKGMSRVRRRFSLVYGKPHATVMRPKRSETIQAGLDDKVIYQVTKEETPLRVIQSWWEKPGFTTFAFLAPAIAAFLLFAWLPMARGFLLSFQKVSLVGESSFVGADNYVRAFNDPLFWATFGHALLFCGLSLGLGFWLPVALAITMNELKRFQGWLRFAFFLPFLTPTVPAVILWRWILDQGYGVLNSVLAMLGLPDPHIPWLNQPMLAMLSVVIVFLWKNTGWNALIYLTALREVPEELYEAAELDGASVRTRVRHVSFPALRTTMGVLLIMQVINSFQIFTEVYLLTQGGPMASTEVIATYLYKKSFLYLDIGYASALAVMLFVVLLSFTSLRMKTIEQEA
jgi:multiple sugar transport system permease protein